MTTIPPPESTAEARDAHGRWRPGHSGNRGGRRPSLSGLIQSKTLGGGRLVRFLIDIMQDSTQVTRDRLRAVELLLSYGFSKPVPSIEDATDADTGLPLVPVHVFQRWLLGARGEETGPRYIAEWGDGRDAGSSRNGSD